MEEQERSTLYVANNNTTSSQQRGPAQFSFGRTTVGVLRSGCAPLVAVMKPANLGDRNDGSAIRRVHGPRFRCVLGQREVRPGFVIVRDERLQVAKQAGFVENYHVVEALAANRADDAFHESSLPRGSRC